MRAWLATLTDEDLARTITPEPMKHPFPLWQYLTHILMHAAQQQADAADAAQPGGAVAGGVGVSGVSADAVRWAVAPASENEPM